MNPKLKICNKSPHENPSYDKPGDSGMDLRDWITKDEHTLNSYDGTFIALQLKPLERRLIHTGIYVEIPYGYEIQVRPKSGQALKKGLIVLNTPGTVDVNYRGEICVIVINLSFDTIIIEDGEKYYFGYNIISSTTYDRENDCFGINFSKDILERFPMD